jgi:hypothetical protein
MEIMKLASDEHFTIIIIALMCMIGTTIVVMAWIIGPFTAYEHGRAIIYKKCMEMNKGDNWTGGYQTSLQEQCFNL